MTYLVAPGIGKLEAGAGITLTPASGQGPIVQVAGGGAGGEFAYCEYSATALHAGAWLTTPGLVTNAPSLFTVGAGDGVSELIIDPSLAGAVLLIDGWGELATLGGGADGATPFGWSLWDSDGAGTTSQVGASNLWIPGAGTHFTMESVGTSKAYNPTNGKLGVKLTYDAGDGAGISGLVHVTVQVIG